MAEDHAGVFRAAEDGVIFRVRVTPRAAANAVSPPVAGVLRVRVTAPPVEGKANQALLKFLAGVLEVPVGRLSILKGRSGREKTIYVAGLDPVTAAERLKGAMRD